MCTDQPVLRDRHAHQRGICVGHITARRRAPARNAGRVALDDPATSYAAIPRAGLEVVVALAAVDLGEFADRCGSAGQGMPAAPPGRLPLGLSSTSAAEPASPARAPAPLAPAERVGAGRRLHAAVRRDARASPPAATATHTNPRPPRARRCPRPAEVPQTSGAVRSSSQPRSCPSKIAGDTVNLLRLGVTKPSRLRGDAGDERAGRLRHRRRHRVDEPRVPMGSDAIGPETTPPHPS